MIRTSLALVAFIASTLAAIAAPQVGQPAPAFAAVDSNGKPHALREFRGKTVVLEWTNDGCPYVQKHYATGNMQNLQRSLTGEGVVWLSVISSAPGKQGHVDGRGANELTASRGAAPTAVLLDPRGIMGRAYEAKTTPHMFVIDGRGILRYMGAIDDKPVTEKASVNGARNYVREAVAAIKAGRPVRVSATDPYGCSVKYP